MPPVPDRGDAVGGGVQEKDYRRGAFVPGEASGLDSVQVVWGVDGNRVSGMTYADTIWEFSGR